MAMVETTSVRGVALQRALAAISRGFVGGLALDAAIDAALAYVGQAAGASRAYLFLLRPDGEVMDNTHEWCAKGVTAQRDQLQEVPCAMFPWWMQTLRAGEVIHIEDVSRLGPEAAAEREILEAQDIKSLVALPVTCRGGFAGFVGLDDVAEAEPWTPDDLALLSIAAEILGTALVRRTDERERERLAEELRAAQRLEAVGRLAGGVAHDFNNILSIVSMYAECLRETMATGSGDASDVDEIANAVRRGRDLVDQLLLFSRRRERRVEPLDLNGVVRGMEKLLRRVLGDHVNLQIDLAADLPPVDGDAGQLEQVVMNLVLNARDAMPNGGTVWIETASPDRRTVSLFVRDSGSGMSQEVAARAFEPFFTTKKPGEGSGLGLAVVYGIVTEHGGTARFDSRLGEGTTAHLSLPAKPAAQPRARSTTPPASTMRKTPRGAGQTILLVEDESALRVVVRRTLTRAGYKVLEAAHPGAALLVAERDAATIDLILSDVIMPELDGASMVQRMHQLRSDIPVVFMSGYAGDATLDRLGLHDDDVLRKPFSAEQLLSRVADALRGSPSRGSPDAHRASSAHG